MPRVYRIIIATIIAAVALSCRVSAGDWSWNISAGTQGHEGWFTGGEFGAWASATDGYDSAFGRNDLPVEPGVRAYIGAFHQTGVDAWVGPTGFYRRDLRAPWRSSSPILAWDLRVWMDPSVPPEGQSIRLVWSRSTQTPPYLSFTLRLLEKPEGVTGGPPVGTTWNLLDFSTNHMFLPAFRTDNGHEGYLFRLTAVPEPSALLVLAGGLMGAVVVMRRRRMR